MEELFNVQSTIKPLPKTNYGEDGVDLNENIREENHDGETIYVYDVKRFLTKTDYLLWVLENK